MLIGITNGTQVKTYRRHLINLLEKIKTEKILIKYSSRGGVGEIVEASYSEEYKLWWYFSSRTDQYWNPFGKGRPSDGRAVTGRCQFNMSKKGLNKRVASAFAVDELGDVYLLHNGKIGGGKKGISKEPFLEWYPAPLQNVNFDGKIVQYFIVAEFGANNFYDQINYFVEQVYAFKESVNTGESTGVEILKRNKVLTNDEGISRNPYSLPARDVLPGANHAMITNELLKDLRSKGVNAFRNRLIDCFIINEVEKITHIFEVKSNLNTQSLYTAVGQLMIYGLKLDAKYYIVLESPVSEKLITDLNKLDIHCVTFNWINGMPKFKKIELK